MAGKLPTAPAFLLKPWADSGDKASIPETSNTAGRASLDLGFPFETQLPLAQGGVAPNRLDFQGILNILSQFAFYYQSGGLMPYSTKVNYCSPALVYHGGTVWFCLASNGPEAGIMVAPGANEKYWIEFNPNAKGGGSVPVGTVIMHSSTTVPEGYLACNGDTFSATAYPLLRQVLGSTTLPDMRGYFVRGYDTRNDVDPDGAARAIRSIQGDAIRNITGRINSGASRGQFGPSSGAFTTSGEGMKHGSGTNKWGNSYVDFRASNVVPTAKENRPQNICLLYCIKHD